LALATVSGGAGIIELVASCLADRLVFLLGHPGFGGAPTFYRLLSL